MRLFLITILSIFSVALFAQDASQKRIDSLGAVFRSMSDSDTNKVVLCNQIASDHYNPDSTIMWADHLIRLARQNKMPFFVAKAYGYYSWSYAQYDDYETSISYNYKALMLADSIGNDRIKAWNYYKMAGNYYYMSNYQLSDKYYHQALEFYQKISDTVWIAHCYRAISENYIYQKMYDQGEVMYKMALELDSITNNKLRISDDYTGIGKCYFRKFLLGDVDSCMDALEKSTMYFQIAYNLNTQSVKNRYYANRYLLDALFFVHKNSAPGSNRRKVALDSMRILSSALDTLRLQMGYERGALRGRLSIIHYQIANGNLREAGLAIDSLQTQIMKPEHKSIRDIFYWVSASYYEAIGDLEKAVLYNQLFYKYLFNENSVNFAVSSTITQMRLEYDRTIAEKDARMQQFTTKVVFAISFILLFVGCLLFFYYRISRHRRALDGANKSLMIQREEIESQRDSLKAKNKLITDSVNYAQTIQKAVLPKDSDMTDLWGDHFIIYKPLSTVSGDFYWTSKVADTKVIV
ncbi:MAG: tetratricopeptide repeat protein, partial [Bacteroidales bacterium]|nr:tetratricopeptide repeat protein [Bacteroidales bacterium]